MTKGLGIINFFIQEEFHKQAHFTHLQSSAMEAKGSSSVGMQKQSSRLIVYIQ